MHNENEVEVISQTCHAAKRAYAAATGNPGLPEWANAPEADKNAIRNRVTTQLQALRTGSGSPPGGPNPTGGGDEEEEEVTNRLTSAIVSSLYQQGNLQQERAAA